MTDSQEQRKSGNASERINFDFLELLNSQFPINDVHRPLILRSASDFAQTLNIHVNHLNRVLKKIHNKSTSIIISEKILQESKLLLKSGNWSISEIAFALGFSEVSHFNNFFKKKTKMNPSQFRK
ncbi:helix-turn-helix domain-containing protein [Algoriphagus marinus]|uniref:helix-turn-helix domain-containing protein n=1 Tax=Algoriphagus marinus TaxID=1925762 RepID=UPI00094B9C98|nr:helix-turn-helix transcriptional regulator [Algoriphagus marinus]